MAKRDELIEFLEAHCDEPLDAALLALSDAQLAALKEYVTGVLEQERAGLDRMFETISQTMKFIPNFLLQSLTHRYIEPPIASRITRKLTMKQAVSIASGLQTNYLIETARYMEPDYGTELLLALPKQRYVEVFEGLLEEYPLKALDMIEGLNDRQLARISPPDSLAQIERRHLGGHRMATLKRLGC